jgi:hypothetical protein
VDGSQRPVVVTVAYLNLEAFRDDYTSGLRASAMTVQHKALETLYLPVQVRFTFPDGDALDCMGQTVARTTQGTAIALELDASQRKTLEELATR